MTATKRKTFVLVHGAWHGGWCWRPVSDILESHGHKVFSPTLTGLGERSHLITKDTNASMHVDDVVNVINWENLSDIVLVGHSYGGVAISGAADRIPERIGSIVFLDAFVPENGESLIEKASTNTQGVINAAIERKEIGIKSPPSSVFGIEEKDRAWVDSKITPQPVATFTEKVTYTGGREKIERKSYIRATGYKSATFDANLAKAQANKSWQAHEFACGHDVMVVQPEQLAELLLKA